MTGQYIIDFLFLYILICHIFKIKYLQEENNRLWMQLRSMIREKNITITEIRNMKRDIQVMKRDIDSLLPWKTRDIEKSDSE